MTNKDMKTLFSSNSDEWYTPIELFDELNKEFEFTLDPCENSDRKLCPKGYSKKDDGLSKTWGGKWYFVIHHIPKFRNGLRNVIEKEQKTIQLLCY